MNEDLSKLDLIQLLDRLEPVPPPPPVSMWPQTEAWLWIGAVLIAASLFAARRLWLRRRANAYRRAALGEIRACGGDPSALAAILRRTALVAYSRASVAGLHGEAWLEFLDRGTGGHAFRQGPGRILATAPYTGGGTPSAEVTRLAEHWVRRHRPDRRGAR